MVAMSLMLLTIRLITGFWLIRMIIRRFNEAWVNKEKIAFAISSDELLSDVIGNGVSCTDNECSVNRMATEDMASTLVRFKSKI